MSAALALEAEEEPAQLGPAEILELAASEISYSVYRVRRHMPTGSRAKALLEEDDLRSEGAVAALEAAKTFDATRGMSLKSWVRQRVAWALADYVRQVCVQARRDPGLCAVEACDGEPFVGATTTTPEQLLIEADTRRWLESAVATRLTPREQILVHKRLLDAEETLPELAATFGLVGHSQVSRDLRNATKKLARAAQSMRKGVPVCG